ncbi:hypothetical protein B0H13DRAFT_501599 [Mycena leptocephala]|nr:hypothetical protein B0H13DRAFT_501599 [Mycena leptocephala]
MATPAAAAAAMTAKLLAVRQFYATSLIGFAVATTIYGISVLQVYLYYRCYPRDRLMLKFTVALLFILDTLGTTFVAHSLYTCYVFNFFDPIKSLEIPWSFAAEKFLVTFTTFVAQSFYAHTIWKATVNKPTTWIIMFLAVASLSLGIVTTEEIFGHSLAVIGTRHFAIISGLVQGIASLNDVLITAALCYFLRRNRRDIPTTNAMVDTLILYAVSRGVLTAIAQILFLITNVGFPGSSYYQPFHQTVGKLYVNSVLALNVRSTFAQRSEIRLGDGPSFIRTAGDMESKLENGHPKPIIFAHEVGTTQTDSSIPITTVTSMASNKQELEPTSP